MGGEKGVLTCFDRLDDSENALYHKEEKDVSNGSRKSNDDESGGQHTTTDDENERARTMVVNGHGRWW